MRRRAQEHLQRQASSEFPSESDASDDSDESEDEAEANGDAAADTADEEEDLFEDEEEDAEEDVFHDDAEGADSSQSKPAELDASLARTRRGSVGALGSAASACTARPSMCTDRRRSHAGWLSTKSAGLDFFAVLVRLWVRMSVWDGFCRGWSLTVAEIV